MAFLSGGSRHDAWVRFCDKHRESLAQTDLPVSVTHSEHKFRELLETGTARAKETTASLADFTNSQLHALAIFAADFFDEFESYAPLDLFPAFRKELQLRQQLQVGFDQADRGEWVAWDPASIKAKGRRALGLERRSPE